MKRLILLLYLFFSGTASSQSITFFSQNQNDFGVDKIRHEFLHEFPYGGFVSGYQVDYRTRTRLAYEYFGKYGKYEKKFIPSLPYGNPQIGFTQVFKNKQVFVSGVGETDKGNRRFSYCFDSTGAINWSFNDSLFILLIHQETDSNYFAQLHSSKDTGILVQGINLVRLDFNGRIYWSKPYDNLYQQLLLDSGIVTPLILDIQLYRGNFVFLLSNQNLEDTKIASFDKDFKLKRQYRSRYTNSSLLSDQGVLIDENVGELIFPRFKITQLDWDFNKVWQMIPSKDSLSSLTQTGAIKLGSKICLQSFYQNSSYNWLDERLEFYNFQGEKTRECRYTYLSTFGITPHSATNDNGLLASATATIWPETKVGFTKTDSLGLVYNTDIICDCKDFKVGVSEVKVPELNVQVFPNPATDKINVLLSHKQEATITLHNLNGQVVKTQAAEFNSNIFDISELDKGLYFVEVISQNSKIIKKLIVE